MRFENWEPATRKRNEKRTTYINTRFGRLALSLLPFVPRLFCCFSHSKCTSYIQDQNGNKSSSTMKQQGLFLILIPHHHKGPLPLLPPPSTPFFLLALMLLLVPGVGSVPRRASMGGQLKANQKRSSRRWCLCTVSWSMGLEGKGQSQPTACRRCCFDCQSIVISTHQRTKPRNTRTWYGAP